MSGMRRRHDERVFACEKLEVDVESDREGTNSMAISIRSRAKFLEPNDGRLPIEVPI